MWKGCFCQKIATPAGKKHQVNDQVKLLQTMEVCCFAKKTVCRCLSDLGEDWCFQIWSVAIQLWKLVSGWLQLLEIWYEKFGLRFHALCLCDFLLNILASGSWTMWDAVLAWRCFQNYFLSQVECLWSHSHHNHELLNSWIPRATNVSFSKCNTVKQIYMISMAWGLQNVPDHWDTAMSTVSSEVRKDSVGVTPACAAAKAQCTVWQTSVAIGFDGPGKGEFCLPPEPPRAVCLPTSCRPAQLTRKPNVSKSNGLTPAADASSNAIMPTMLKTCENLAV